MRCYAEVLKAARLSELHPGFADHSCDLGRPVSLAGARRLLGRGAPGTPTRHRRRQVPGNMLRTRGAADQVPQKLVVLGVHGERCRGRVLPVRVIPEVREQDLNRLVYGKARDVLGYEVLTY